MGEQKRKKSLKEQVSMLERRIFELTGSLAIHEALHGPLSNDTVVRVYKKLPKDSYNNFDEFGRDLFQAALAVKLELEVESSGELRSGDIAPPDATGSTQSLSYTSDTSED